MKTGRGIAIFLAASFIMTACGSQNTDKEMVLEVTESSMVKSQTVGVERGDIRVSASYDAQVGPRVVQLTFEEEGIFGEYLVELGEAVKQGDILAVPDTRQMEKNLEAKEQELSDLTANFEYQKASLENQIEILKLRMQDVYDQIEKEEYLTPKYTELCVKVGNYDEEKKRIELQLRQLQETYDMELPHCQSQLQKLQEKCTGNKIVAPFDGIVVALYDVKGNGTEAAAINKNLYYVAIADPTVLYARCDYISPSIANNALQTVFWKDGVESEAAYIPMTEKAYRVMKNSGEVMYSEFMLKNPEGTIQSADYGKIRLVTVEKKQVLYLPEVAILTDAGGAYVYREQDGNRERVSVEVGSKDGLHVEIVSGLEEGDVVYVQE